MTYTAAPYIYQKQWSVNQPRPFIIILAHILFSSFVFSSTDQKPEELMSFLVSVSVNNCLLMW